MTGFDPEPFGLSLVPQRAAEAQAALDALREPGERAARSIEDAFSRAGDSLARSLGRAAADGKLSLGELAEAVIAAVNAAGGAQGGLADVLSGVVSSVFAGARADGGPVAPGGAYLVGERGPEVFRPSAAGDIGPLGGGVTVNVMLQGETTAGLVRSEAQLAQALARAVSLGARRL